MMPEILRESVEDLAERLQVPVDFPAAAMMGCLAGGINRRAFIRPKANDPSWILPGNLWSALVGPPGVLAKSPILNAATQPLHALEELWRNEYSTEIKEYELQKEDVEIRLAAWKEQTKAAIKNKKQPTIRPDTNIRPPTRRRLIINDATSAASHKLMAINPAGLLLIRDELIGWISQLDAPGRESERAMALEAWNGNTSFTIDRIERGEIHVPCCCLSVIGGITPARLRAYLIESMRDGPTDDGFAQRFQVLVFPDAPKNFRYVDKKPCDSRVLEMFTRITSIDPAAPLVFGFDTDAQDYFIEWYVALQKRLRSGDLHPALTSHLSKFPKLLPTLALNCAVADGVTPDERIGLAYAQLGAHWCDVLETHANRVYSCVVSGEMQAAADLSEKIKARKIGENGTFHRRDVYKNSWSGLDDPIKVLKALEILQDAGWVRQAPPKSGTRPVGGRPPELWIVNPRIIGCGPIPVPSKPSKPPNK
jgi:putative DNA primase/helicase